MSFILDSLKKSSEEQTKAGPANLLALVAQRDREEKSRSYWLWIFLLIIVALSSFFLAWWLFRGGVSEKMDPQRKIAPPVETRVLASPLHDISTPPDNGQEPLPWSHATVTGILGPCLLELNWDGTPQKVTLAHIQCLGDKTLAGKSARTFLVRFVFTRNILFIPIARDHRGMTSVEIQSPAEGIINGRLVAEGLAKASGPRWQKEEQSARQGQRGMWRDPKQWTAVPEASENFDHNPIVIPP
ncbi:MAG: hypothetical protein HQL75_05335 [Magnetococcales bacterium]|nr:hypothetical protein [Magnetococcales bacterium]